VRSGAAAKRVFATDGASVSQQEQQQQARPVRKRRKARSAAGEEGVRYDSLGMPIIPSLGGRGRKARGRGAGAAKANGHTSGHADPVDQEAMMAAERGEQSGARGNGRAAASIGRDGSMANGAGVWSGAAQQPADDWERYAADMARLDAEAEALLAEADSGSE
jgi:hypothetical protein